MSYSTVIAQIDTVLKSATGVVDNNVYKYDRLEREWTAYLSAFKDATNSVIHGYTITRVNWTEIREASRSNLRTTKWIIRGYYSLGSSGETEATFQGIIDNIATKFSEDPRLNSTVLSVESFNLDILEARMFGDVLCHYAEMSLTTEEQINY